MIFALILTASAAACFGGSETSNTGTADIEPRPGVEVNAANTDSKPEETPIKMEEIYPTADYSQNTPTDAMRTWVMATVNKDVPTLNRILSRPSLEMLEESAKAQGRTLGEALTEGAVRNISKNIPEFRNEKITGDAATVEFKDDTMNRFLTMSLVREDGKWKVAFDVFTRELLRMATEDMNKPAPKTGK